MAHACRGSVCSCLLLPWHCCESALAATGRVRVIRVTLSCGARQAAPLTPVVGPPLFSKSTALTLRHGCGAAAVATPRRRPFSLRSIQVVYNNLPSVDRAGPRPPAVLQWICITWAAAQQITIHCKGKVFFSRTRCWRSKNNSCYQNKLKPKDCFSRTGHVI